MASAIDASKPADGIVASKAELRANLATAKAEITALQTQVGAISPYIFNGMRNRIINGRMILNSRFGSSVVPVTATGTAVWGPDRFYGVIASPGGAFSMQAFTSGGPIGHSVYVRLTTTTARTLAAGDVHAFNTAVEGYHWADMLYGTANAVPATLSFWVRSSIAGAYAVSIHNAALAQSYVTSYTINIANTWEQKTITIPGPIIGTWATQGTTGVGVRFDLGHGSTFQGVVNTWTSTAKTTYTGATSLIATNGATLDLTAIQLEPGSVATPWDHRLIANEASLSQRYYQANGGARWDGTATTGVTHSTFVPFLASMRATPTVLTNLTSNTAFPASNPSVSTPTFAGFYATLVANATGGGSFAFNWTADAEITV